MHFCVEVVRKLFTDKPEKKWKKKKKERESDVWIFPGLEEGSGNPQLKMGRLAQLQPKRKPSQGRQLLLLNTRESRFAPNLLPYTARSREIFSSREWVVNMVYYGL